MPMTPIIVTAAVTAAIHNRSKRRKDPRVTTAVTVATHLLKNCRNLRQNLVHDRIGYVFQLSAVARAEIEQRGAGRSG